LVYAADLKVLERRHFGPAKSPLNGLPLAAQNSGPGRTVFWELMQPGPEGGLGGDQNRLDRHPSAALRLDHGDAETAVRQLHDDHSFSE
jgi:hypothetical protein